MIYIWWMSVQYAKEGTVQKVVNFSPFKRTGFLSDNRHVIRKIQDRYDSTRDQCLFLLILLVIPNSDKLGCVCLLVCLKKKKAFSSDEWLFFFRKVTTTFSANEMMKMFCLWQQKTRTLY